MTFRRVAVCALPLLGLATGCAGSSSLVHTPPQPSRASRMCTQQVDGTTLVDVSTVEVLESIGPRAGSTRPTDGPFAAYPVDQQVALCLKPIGGGEAEVWAVVMGGQDEKPIQVWTQSPDDQIDWPS